MKTKKRWISRIITFCLCMIMCLGLMPLNISADETVSVTLYHCIDGNAVADIPFSIYRVGSYSENGELELASAFAKYHIFLSGEDTTDWKNLVRILAQYCIRDNITPDESRKTDENGVIVFGENDQLSKGVYLILGDDHVYDDILYDIQPIMLNLPIYDEDGILQYSVGVETKYETAGSSDTLTVFKIWDDKNAKNRPDSVSIQLIDNTNKCIYAEVVLNETNNWTYTWNNLPTDRTWGILEKEVPEEYLASIQCEQNQVEVKNIKTTFAEEVVPDKIIQTGTLWWPVPILAMTGILFVLIGMLRRQRNE